MIKSIRFLFIGFLFLSTGTFAQVSSSNSSQDIVLDPIKVSIYEKYCSWKHDLEPGGFVQWKANNPDLYLKEMWYYTESFYIKRDSLTTGIALPESSIDISRFETKRKPAVEKVVVLPGFKDVVVLMPENKLIYKLK